MTTSAYSIPSYTLRSTIGTFTVPDPPTNVKVFSGDSKFYLSWENSPNNTGCPTFKFEISVFDMDANVPVTETPIVVHRYEGATAYETHALLIDNTNAVVLNNRRYQASIVSVNAVGSSLAEQSDIVLVAPSYRQVEVDNLKYKKFYPYPLELSDPVNYGAPLYPETVVEYGDAYLSCSNTYPLTLGSANNVLHLYVSEYGTDETLYLPLPIGVYNDATQLAAAVTQAISVAWDTALGPISLRVSNTSSSSFTLVHTPTSDIAQLEFSDGVNSANDVVFGANSYVVSPNRVVHVENHIPTVRYDLGAKKCLVDNKPYVPITERFEIIPATRSILTQTDYPLSFSLSYKDIRAGSVTVEWYVKGIKEIISDTGNGFLISSTKVDACSNKIPSQQLGVIDYASGIISCTLPEITSGYATVYYAANSPVMDAKEYIWAPTPHFGLNIILKEPVYFGASQWSYLNQNANRLRPGYTVLEFVNATIHLRSTLSDVVDTVVVE